MIMQQYRCFSALLSLYLGVILTINAFAEEVSVAVAANFTAPFKEIITQYQKDTGNSVRASYGATGNFYSQIKNGAPFQVLLAADSTTPPNLINEKAAVKNSDFVYAKGKLVLWSADRNRVDSQGKVLDKNQFNHLAMADPDLAPYGAAAQQTMQKLGVYDKLKSKIVMGQNITQTYQFIVTGNSELGFVALSQVYAQSRYKEGSVWVVPSDLYHPINQSAVLLNNGANSVGAKSLLTYLKSPFAKGVIKSYGYNLP